MYTIIDENEEQQKYQEVVSKITPEMLGLKPTNDFAQYAQQTIIDDNPEKAKEWKNKGSINVMEAGKRFAAEFDGSYDNIDPSANFNAAEKALFNSGINNVVDERIERQKREKAARNKRVNDGTASILDRIGASLDRWGNASYNVQLNDAKKQTELQQPNKDNPNYKYKPAGVDMTGKVIYNEVDLKKKIGFFEALSDSIGQGKALPFAGGWIEGSGEKKFRDIAERIRNGESIRQDELDYINKRIEAQNEEYIRGYSIGGKIGEAFLPSLLAFGGEMMLGGAALKGLNLAGKGTGAATNFGKNLLKSGKVSKGTAKAVAFTTGQLAEGAITAAVTTAVNPQRLFATYQERRLNDEMKITDRGTVIFSEAKEAPAVALMKSLGQVYISYFTENMGALIGAPIKAGSNFAKNIGSQQFARVIENNPILEKLIQRTAPFFAKAYEKLNNLPIKGKSVDWLKSQVKFDGFMEELGEEVLEDILNLTVGTDNEARTLENYVSKIVKTPEEWAILCGVIALQGTALSIAGNTLGGYMQSNGSDFEDISKVLQNSTENEKLEYIDDLIKNGNIRINEDGIHDNSGAISEIKNRYFTQNLNAGLEKEEALSAADIQANAVASLAKNIGMDINELNKEFAINTQSLSTEQAKEQQRKDVLMLQGGVEMNVERHNQLISYSYNKENIERSFNDSVENIQKNIKSDVSQILLDNNVDESEFNFEDLRIYGSYATGKNKRTSDLDVVVQYSGSMREDDAFNMFAESNISLIDSYGNEVKIDINPINVSDSGTIEEYLQHILNLEPAVPTNEATYNQETFDVENPNIYYQSDNNLNDLLSAQEIKIKDILPFISELQNIKEFFDGIEDVNIDFVESEQTLKNNLNGYYDAKSDTIFLNKDSFSAKNIPVARIKTFLHELQHAHQKKKYDFYKNELKNNKNISEEQAKEYNKYIQDYDSTLKANREYRKFKNKYYKELIDLYTMKRNHGYNNFIREIQKPENKKLFDIATSNNKYYNEYRNSALEQEAESTAVDLIYKLGLGEQYENQKRKADEKNFGRSGKSGSSIYDRRVEYGSGRSVQDGRRVRTNDEGTSFSLDPEIYYQSDSIDNARGFTYQRFNFDGTTKDNLIVLLKNKSDKSTLLHEFAHVYLTTLNNLALRNDRAKELLVNVNKWLNYNGVEYTRQQHEKFANGFVAYVKSGKAPTYGLKRAFENFKRWLNDLYTSLSLSDDIELDKETQKIFDELLGDKSIKSKENKIAEIIKKAKENATLRLSYEYAEKRQIQPFHLTEKQRRYRDTAYDIVYYALANSKDENGQPLVKDKRELYMLFGNESAYNKKNKGIKHRKEKLEQYLLETEDVFSGGDGFLPEWGEFFYNPGVDNGSNEIGANVQLARQAFEVITEKRYLYDTNSYDRTGFTDEDIKKTQYELDYIIEQYKNSKEKDLPMAAFFEWIDSVHPYIQEDIITQWEAKTNEIDRYESLTEFQKAKEDLKLYAATLKGHGDYSWQFAQYARQILKRLDFMTEYDKAKIFEKLKDYDSFREIERDLDNVMDYAETLNDVSLRKNLADTILNEIKRTTPEIVKGTKKTRYDYQTNKLFERLRQINRMKQEEVKDLYDAYVNNEMERREKQFEESGTITGKTEDYFEDIENSFIQFKANGVYYNSTEALQTLLEKIQNAKFTGKVARDEMDFERRMKQENLINQCAKALETHRGEVGILEKLYSMEANFDSMLSMLFDDNIKNEFSLDDLYAQVDGRVGKDREEVLNKIADVFDFEGPSRGFKLNSKFIEMANDKYTIRQRYAKKYETDSLGVWDWEEITLSRMEILYYYIQAKNPTSYQMLTDMGDENRSPKGQFDKYEFDALLENLSDQEKLMGDILQLAAEKYYNDLNKYHIKKHHIDMGKVTCYFPRKSELSEVNELDLFNQYTEKSTNPGFVKIRSAGPSVRITPANPVNVLFNHIQKANTIIFMGEKLDLINKVFRDNDLKQKIKSVYGDLVYREFMQHVTENLYNGQTNTLSQAEGILSKLMSNIIASPMLIKPQIGIKQIMGLINYGVGDEYVGTIEWMKAFGDVIKHPKAAINFMMQDEYLKDRLTRANLNEAMKNQIDQKMFSKLSLMTDYFSLNMRLGDMLNLTLGGKAYVDVLLKKGFTKEQAFELFRKKTISDQQSSISSTLSNMQRNTKNNPFARLLFAYQNTPHQYFRICANAVIKAKQGKIPKTQAAKTMFIYWWLLPFIFNMAGSLSPILYLTTGDPEEIYNDMLVACLGPITCIPFFGEMARAAFAGITGQEYFGNKDWFTRANEAIVKPIQKTRKGELEFGDILKSLEVFAMAFGIPLEELSTQIESIGDYANGDIAKGFLKNIGYSRYRAKLLTGEEE